MHLVVLDPVIDCDVQITMKESELKEIGKFIGYSSTTKRESICDVTYNDQVLIKFFSIIDEEFSI